MKQILVVALMLLIVSNVSAIDVTIKDEPVGVKLPGHIEKSEIVEQAACLKKISMQIYGDQYGLNGTGPVKPAIIGGLLTNNKPCVVLELVKDID